METTDYITEEEYMKKNIERLKEENPLDETRKFIDTMSEKDIQIMSLFDTKLRIFSDTIIGHMDNKFDKRFDDMDKRFDRIEKILSER